MAPVQRHAVIAAIRQRIVHGLETGALRDGTRLPRVRELALELHASTRTVAAAYRALAADGLVELKPRSGVFVSRLVGGLPAPRVPTPAWLADVMTRAVADGVPLRALSDAVGLVASSANVNVVVIANIADQIDGLARELREYYGVRVSGLALDSLARGQALPRALRRAHILVTTPANAESVRKLAERLAKPHIVACIRDDLPIPGWRELLSRPIYVVVADPAFGEIARRFVAGFDPATNLRVVVAGREPMNIPPDAPTYITESARLRLGATRLPGRLIAPTHLLTRDCAHQLLEVIIRRNFREPSGSSQPPRHAPRSRSTSATAARGHHAD